MAIARSNTLFFRNLVVSVTAVGLRFLAIWIAAGPTSTTKMPGKMNSTSGKISCTAVLAAFSSANLPAAGPHRVRLHAQGLGDARAEPVGLDQDGRQAADVVDAGADAQVVQHLAPRPAHLQLEVGQREFLAQHLGVLLHLVGHLAAWPRRGPGRSPRTPPSGPARRAASGRSPAAASTRNVPEHDVRQVEADSRRRRRCTCQGLTCSTVHSSTTERRTAEDDEEDTRRAKRMPVVDRRGRFAAEPGIGQADLQFRLFQLGLAASAGSPRFSHGRSWPREPLFVRLLGSGFDFGQRRGPADAVRAGPRVRLLRGEITREQRPDRQHDHDARRPPAGACHRSYPRCPPRLR